MICFLLIFNFFPVSLNTAQQCIYRRGNDDRLPHDPCQFNSLSLFDFLRLHVMSSYCLYRQSLKLLSTHSDQGVKTLLKFNNLLKNLFINWINLTEKIKYLFYMKIFNFLLRISIIFSLLSTHHRLFLDECKFIWLWKCLKTFSASSCLCESVKENKIL